MKTAGGTLVTFVRISEETHRVAVEPPGDGQLSDALSGELLE